MQLFIFITTLICFQTVESMERSRMQEQAKQFMTILQSIPIATPAPAAASEEENNVACLGLSRAALKKQHDMLHAVEAMLAKAKIDFLQNGDPIEIIKNLEFTWRQKICAEHPGYIFTNSLVTFYKSEQHKEMKELLALYIISHYPLNRTAYAIHGPKSDSLIASMRNFLKIDMGWFDADIDSCFNQTPSRSDLDFTVCVDMTCLLQ